MSIRVWLDGRVVPPEQARVSVFDRGFLYGDGVFETVTTTGGGFPDLDAHLDRLARSASRIGLEVPPRESIQRAVLAAVAEAGNLESRVRIIVTRGGDTWGDLDPANAGPPRLVVIAGPKGGPTDAMVEQGVAVEVVPLVKGGVDPSVKSGNYLQNLLAVREARRRAPDAHEALLCAPDGSVAEGATSNVFCVKNGTLRTPPLEVGILGGVTRAKVLELAREAGISVEEARLRTEDLYEADEVFITSAGRAVLPVTRVDRRPVRDGRPGPVTLRLRNLYLAAARAAGGSEGTRR